MKTAVLKSGRTAVVRQAEEDDAGKLMAYLQQIAGESDYLTFGPGEFQPTLEEQIAVIKRYRACDNQLFILAETEGTIVGTLVFTGGARPRIRHTGEFGVSVLREFWGQGVATVLIASLLQWAGMSGVIRKINLKVRTDHQQGVRLYQKMGFTVEGRLTREFLVGGTLYDAYLMGKVVD